MTKPSKGLYYYAVRILLFVMAFPAFAALMALLSQYHLGTLFTDWLLTAEHATIVGAFAYLCHEMVGYGKGYTIVYTTKYKLFKCRESGKDETFMMFADSEEELERFFEYSHPEKVVFIEPFEMEGKAITMKVFNRDWEESQQKDHQ